MSEKYEELGYDDLIRHFRAIVKQNQELKAKLDEADESLGIEQAHHIKEEKEFRAEIVRLCAEIERLKQELQKAQDFVRYVNTVCDEEGSYRP